MRHNQSVPHRPPTGDRRRRRPARPAAVGHDVRRRRGSRPRRRAAGRRRGRRRRRLTAAGPTGGLASRVSVAVVTDSTAYLPADWSSGYGIGVVPLYVVLAGRSGREGMRHQPGRRRPGARRPRPARCRPPARRPVTSSPPTGGASTRGAERIVSVHLSAELSGTCDAARLAAAQVGEHLVTVRRLPLRRDGRRVRRAGRGAGGGRRRRRGRGGRGRPDDRGRHPHVLRRRHPRAPAPRRPDRSGGRACSARRCRSSRCCTCGRPGRSAGEGAHLRPGADPAGPARGRGGRGRAGVAWRCTTSPRPSAPSGWRPSCGSGCPRLPSCS